MIVTYKEPYKDGELRIGWASWDDGSLTNRSIKYAYRDSSGKISRGSPELPFDILIDMLVLARDQNETDSVFNTSSTRATKSVENLSQNELIDERKQLASSLMILQKIMMDLPWADFRCSYDQIGERYESVKKALAAM